MIFGKLRALSDVFIGITIAIPERASVSFPIELQTDSRNKFPESVIHIDYNRYYCRYRIRRVFRLFFIPVFVPYFKWILPLFERKGEKNDMERLS